MRDKLIELMNAACFTKEKDRLMYGEARLTFEEFANYLIAHGVTVQEWIPVGEMLPENSGLTLVRVDFFMWDEKVNVPSLERYVNEEKAWYLDGVKLTNVTHWMPLPTAPKEVE